MTDNENDIIEKIMALVIVISDAVRLRMMMTIIVMIMIMSRLSRINSRRRLYGEI